MSLKDRLSDPGRMAECIADVETMITEKESVLARAEWGSCCGNIRSLADRLEGEVQMLLSILGLLREGDSRAAAVLDDYIALLQDGYAPEPECW